MDALLSLAALCIASIVFSSVARSEGTDAAAMAGSCVSAVLLPVSILTSEQRKAHRSNLWIATGTKPSGQLFANLELHL